MENNAESDELSLYDVVNRIKDIYSSEEYIQLKQKFAYETYLEAIAKENSETVFSSFLWWIFQNNSFCNLTDTPLHNLLRLLACNSIIQSSNNNVSLGSLFEDEKLCRNIVCNDIRLTTKLVKTEFPTYSKDRNGRLDLMIVFEADNLGGSYKKRVRILLENKVYSTEHSAQCSKYYEFFKNKNHDCNRGIDIDIFVFLSIDKPQQLSCDNYICITYQELLDSVLMPLIKQGENYPQKYLAYVKDFIDTITTIKTNNRQQIAMDKDTKELLRTFYKKNEDLIIAAIMQSDNAELKATVEKERKQRKTFHVDVTGGEVNDITGMPEMVHYVINHIAQNMKAQDIVDHFKVLGNIFWGQYMLSLNENDYIEMDANGNVTKRRHLGNGEDRLLYGNDGVRVFCSNQFNSNDNIAKFIKLVNQSGFGINIEML